MKRVTKMKKLFKTVFGRSNKKLPVDAPAEAFVEGPLEQTVDSSFDVQSPVEASGEVCSDENR